VKHPLVGTVVLKYSFSIQEVLKLALVILEVLKHFFNTEGAETSTCNSSGIETTNLRFRGTKIYQRIFGHDRSFFCLKTKAHITGLHGVTPSLYL
jgi:hypothetical protein